MLDPKIKVSDTRAVVSQQRIAVYSSKEAQAVLGDISDMESLRNDLLNYQFDMKVFEQAKQFLSRKLNSRDYKAQLQIDPLLFKDYRKSVKEENPEYNRMTLHIYFSKWQRIFSNLPSMTEMKSFVDALNKEFQTKRRLGLFILEEYNDGYGLFFNPSSNDGIKTKYLFDARNIARQLAKKDFSKDSIFNKDEIFSMHMLKSFFDDFIENANGPFRCFRSVSVNGIKFLFEDRGALNNFIQAIQHWNEYYNVEERVGKFSHQSKEYLGSIFCLLSFQPSLDNKSYDNFRDAILTDQVINKVEEFADVVYDSKKA